MAAAAATVGCSLATCQLARPVPTGGVRLAFLLPRRPRRTFASTASLRARTDKTATTATDGKDSKSSRGGRPRVPTRDEAQQLRDSIASTANTSTAGGGGAYGPSSVSRGSLGSGSIFDEDDGGETRPDPLQTTNQRVPQRRKKKTQEQEQEQEQEQDGDGKGGGDTPVKIVPLEDRNLFNVDRSLNPNPRARELWLRRKVIQAVKRRGKLTREEQIMRTERASGSRSHWFKTSLKKLGPLARQIAGKNIDDAILQMRFSAKQAAGDVRKFLEQAKNEAVVARGMGLNALRQQQREKELATVRAEKVQKTRGLHLVQQRVAELQELQNQRLEAGEQAPPQNNVTELTDLDQQSQEQQQQQPTKQSPTTGDKKPEQQETEKEKEQPPPSETQEQRQRRQQMTLEETKRQWLETMAQADAADAAQEAGAATEAEAEASVSSSSSSSSSFSADDISADTSLATLQDRLDAIQPTLITTQQALDDISAREADLAEAIRAARPEPVDIVLRDGRPLRIADPSAIYIAQAWVNRGPYGQDYDHRARGRINVLRLPYTGLSVVLKEEHTRIREAREREEREERRRREKVWVQLPDRKIYAQRQYYCW